MVDLYIREQESMNSQIKALEQQLRIKIADAEREQQRYFAKHHALYDHYQGAAAVSDGKVTRYYEMSKIELEVKDDIIEKLQQQIENQT